LVMIRNKSALASKKTHMKCAKVRMT
jgi:hypothetical protein